MLTHIILLSISIVFPLLFLALSPALTKEILRDLRLIRILHYVALAALGFALYFKDHELSLLFFPGKILVFPLFIIALIYAAVFAIVTNNIADIETDKISNPKRPLVLGTVQLQPYRLAGICSLIFSLLLSLAVQAVMFYGIFIISAGYYIYSCRPFRLKRIPVIAKLIIGVNSLVVAVCGFMLAGGELNNFPLVWAVFIILPLSLAANFVDLKDTAGDGISGIRTLPVILGQKKAINLICFFTICTYAMAAIIVNLSWVYPLCGVMAVLHIVLLYRKPYNEKPIFLVYISALFGLNIILLFSKYLI